MSWSQCCCVLSSARSPLAVSLLQEVLHLWWTALRCKNIQSTLCLHIITVHFTMSVYRCILVLLLWTFLPVIKFWYAWQFLKKIFIKVQKEVQKYSWKNIQWVFFFMSTFALPAFPLLVLGIVSIFRCLWRFLLCNKQLTPIMLENGHLKGWLCLPFLLLCQLFTSSVAQTLYSVLHD